MPVVANRDFSCCSKFLPLICDKAFCSISSPTADTTLFLMFGLSQSIKGLGATSGVATSSVGALVLICSDSGFSFLPQPIKAKVKKETPAKYFNDVFM